MNIYLICSIALNIILLFIIILLCIQNKIYEAHIEELYKN